jgi:hypothetical protein
MFAYEFIDYPISIDISRIHAEHGESALCGDDFAPIFVTARAPPAISETDRSLSRSLKHNRVRLIPKLVLPAISRRDSFKRSFNRGRHDQSA